jgi:hypothetical protein
MTRSSGFARIGLNSARWLLPLIAVLFVSVTLAYGMNTVIARNASASGHQPSSREAAAAPAGEQSITSLSGTSAALADGDDVRARFLASLTTAAAHDSSYAAGTSPAKTGSGSTFGVMSMTSPASTGHASPNGCCTWN